MIEGSTDGGTAAGEDEYVRTDLRVHGAVQGVGFRPFVYRAARDLGLSGWVLNDVRGVSIRLEGPARAVDAFRERLEGEPPPRAVIDRIDERRGAPSGIDRFEIRHSEDGGPKLAFVLPDTATCDDCLHEVLAPADRRYLYPFTNCTNCGPRFSIIRELPYDRPRTTMAGFRMCPECRREYEDPLDRRFHAQPNACPRCGPRTRFVVPGDDGTAWDDEALDSATLALESGRIVALKGLGGYQLLVDGRAESAVQRLRRRKNRPTKPLACMVADVAAAREIAEVGPSEARLLAGPEAPIVLLRRRADAGLAGAVAPDRHRIGVMLPATPLHHLLARRLEFPLVATSGNLSEEPICIRDEEALHRLGGIADGFLMHDRPVERHVDDSVAWVVDGAPQLLRRARGWAPLPVPVGDGPAVLALGAHQKNVVALAVGGQAFLSQHIGDLETVESRAAFERVIGDFLRLYDAEPVAVAHDLHPDYASTRWLLDGHAPAALRTLPTIPVQHHHAHLAACLAEYAVDGPALGVIWDGTGLGTDGTIWGGELLLGDAGSFRRVGRLRPFMLPGGEAAVREPWRVSLALARQARVDPPAVAADGDAVSLVEQMMERGINAPWTSSAGRLFDGVAAWLGLGGDVSYEGEAAIRLEELARGSRPDDGYGFPVTERPEGRDDVGTAPELEIDWRPAVANVAADVAGGRPLPEIAARFHVGLAVAMTAAAERLDVARVVLSGGCFQNRRLLSAASERLESTGHEVLFPRRAPVNDGGIALGQVAVARAALENGATLDEPEEG